MAFGLCPVTLDPGQDTINRAGLRRLGEPVGSLSKNHERSQKRCGQFHHSRHHATNARIAYFMQILRRFCGWTCWNREEFRLLAVAGRAGDE
jgi:hypothetical protein